MNEQERLQRVIDILSDNISEICEVDHDGRYDTEVFIDSNINGIQTVAREICNVFENKIKTLREEINELENEMIQKELETL